MISRPRLVATLAIVTVALPLPAPATILQTIGGPGGSPFELRCADDEYMIGVRANVGAWVDGLAILCTKGSSSPARQVGWVGGRGGMDQESYCPEGGRAWGFMGNFTRADRMPRQFLNAVALSCFTGQSSCIDSGQRCDWGNEAPSSFNNRFADRQSCPGKEVLVGLVGRAGSYVDAIGAICGPADGASSGAQTFESAPSSSAAGPAYSPATNLPSNFGSGPRVTSVFSSPAAPSVIPQLGQCRSGYVWREAGSDDHICVTPQARERVRSENSIAVSRVDPNSAYGPNGCQPGFVWREAFAGDLACVYPDSRSAAAEENAAHHQYRH